MLLIYHFYQPQLFEFKIFYKYFFFAKTCSLKSASDKNFLSIFPIIPSSGDPPTPPFLFPSVNPIIYSKTGLTQTTVVVHIIQFSNTFNLRISDMGTQVTQWYKTAGTIFLLICPLCWYHFLLNWYLEAPAQYRVGTMLPAPFWYLRLSAYLVLNC